MFDLSAEPDLPRYELKTRDGEVKSYDPVLIAYNLRGLEKEEDPAKVRKTVCEVFAVDVTALDALTILENFLKFTEECLEEPLKKVFGRVLSSTTSTGSRPANTKS